MTTSTLAAADVPEAWDAKADGTSAWRCRTWQTERSRTRTGPGARSGLLDVRAGATSPPRRLCGRISEDIPDVYEQIGRGEFRRSASGSASTSTSTGGSTCRRSS